jgi:hypothetical protein
LTVGGKSGLLWWLLSLRELDRLFDACLADFLKAIPHMAL